MFQRAHQRVDRDASRGAARVSVSARRSRADVRHAQARQRRRALDQRVERSVRDARAVPQVEVLELAPVAVAAVPRDHRVGGVEVAGEVRAAPQLGRVAEHRVAPRAAHGRDHGHDRHARVGEIGGALHDEPHRIGR